MTPQELGREYAYQYRQYRRLWRKFLAARERYNANPTPELASEKVRIFLRHKVMQADLLTLKKQLHAGDTQALKDLHRKLDVINSTKGQEQERELYECLNDAGATDLNAIKGALAVKYHYGMKAKQQNSENGKLSKGVPKSNRVDYTKAKKWAAAIWGKHPKHSARQVAAIIISPTETQRKDYGIDDTYAGMSKDHLRKHLK